MAASIALKLRAQGVEVDYGVLRWLQDAAKVDPRDQAASAQGYTFSLSQAYHEYVVASRMTYQQLTALVALCNSDPASARKATHNQHVFGAKLVAHWRVQHSKVVWGYFLAGLTARAEYGLHCEEGARGVVGDHVVLGLGGHRLILWKLWERHVKLGEAEITPARFNVVMKGVQVDNIAYRIQAE